MDMGKSFAWILFLAVVAGAGSLGHHRDDNSQRPAPGPAVQLAAPAPAPVTTPAATSTVALDTTAHGLVTRTAVRVVK